MLIVTWEWRTALYWNNMRDRDKKLHEGCSIFLNLYDLCEEISREEKKFFILSFLNLGHDILNHLDNSDKMAQYV